MNKEERIKHILTYATKNVDFYRNINSSNKISLDINSFPIVEKEQIINNLRKFMSDEYVKEVEKNNIIRRRTSGTTGKSLNVLWSVIDDKYSMMSLWMLRKKYYGITPENNMCYFFSESRNKENYTFSQNGKILGINKKMLDLSIIDDMYRMIDEFEPEWMIMQPSVAILLANYIKKENKSFKTIKYIEFTGELLSNVLKNRFVDVFQCMIANQYGCNEANSIAYECPKGNLHCMENNVYVEVLDDEKKVMEKGEFGNIYITSLHNHCMPFIRYGIGDYGRISKCYCGCGNSSPIIELKKGRNCQFIKNRDGSFESVYALFIPIDTINDLFGEVVLQFQIIQKDFDQFYLRIVLNQKFGGWKKAFEEMYIDYLDISDKEKREFVFFYENELFSDSYNEKTATFISEI